MSQQPSESPAADGPPSLGSLFLAFLKIGCVAFGGFMSLVAVIETVFVERRKLLRHEEMLDGISLGNLLPGPLAVNVVAYVGFRLRGFPGAMVSAAGVILPAFVLMLGLTHVYFEYGDVPALGAIFSGVTPAVAAVIAAVVLRMAKKSLVGRVEWTLALVAAALLLLAPRESKLFLTFGVVATYGLLGQLLFRGSFKGLPPAGPKGHGSPVVLVLTVCALAALPVLSVLPLEIAEDGLLRLGLTFGGLGVMLFGGGYVMIPMIQDVVVLQQSWMTEQQFIDGIALGQVTPGPILISATFIGLHVAGLAGAVVATLAIFAPPALLMVTAASALERMRGSVWIQAAMRCIRCGIVGLIFTAAWVILEAAITAQGGDPGGLAVTLGVFGLSLVALVRLKADVLVVIPAAGALGFLAGAAGLLGAG